MGSSAISCASTSAPRETDRAFRRPVGLRGFGVLADGTTFGLSVVNLSYDGCRIASQLALLRGVKLKISIPGLGRAVDARVQWHKDGYAGLKFGPEEEQEPPQKLRSYERIEVDAELSLRRYGRHHYVARLFDLTPKGCRVEFIERPKCGEMMWAKLEDLGSIPATVRWVDGFDGGLEFVRPIYPAVFDLLLARLQQKRRRM